MIKTKNGKPITHTACPDGRLVRTRNAMRLHLQFLAVLRVIRQSCKRYSLVGKILWLYYHTKLPICQGENANFFAPRRSFSRGETIAGKVKPFSCQARGSGKRKKPFLKKGMASVGHDLFSRPVARRVSSALQSLTTVFGMGTGGPSALMTLTVFRFACVGFDLSSRAVARRVLSALQSLTTVFGMGTGGPSALIKPTLWCTFRDSNPGPTD